MRRADADGLLPLSNFAALDQADASCVSFLWKCQVRWSSSQMLRMQGLVLVPVSKKSMPRIHAALVLVENPMSSLSTVIIKEFGVEPSGICRQAVHAAAWVDPIPLTFDPAETVSVLAERERCCAGASKSARGRGSVPGAVVGENAVIGEDCEIGPNVSIREGCILGDRVIRASRCRSSAGDGFGFEFVEGRHRKDRSAWNRPRGERRRGRCLDYD